MDSRQYYIITFAKGDQLHRMGEQVRNEHIPLVIGQCADSGVRLPSDERYEDENFAVIVKNPQNEGGWRLIRLCDAVEITVNGERMCRVHYLQENDRIAFEGQECELVFSTGEESLVSGKKVEAALRKMNRRLFAAVFGAVALLALTFVLWQRFTDCSVEAGDVPENSILKIRLESVELQHVDLVAGKEVVSVVEKISVAEAGTGFLTSSGKFVTARHCIEPWLDESPEDSTSALVRMALAAENYDMDNGSYRRLVSKGSVFSTANDGGRTETMKFRFSSDTCLYFTRNDCIENLGTVRNPKYWRSLGHEGKISSIGDVVCLNVPFVGELEIADIEMVKALEKNRETGTNGIPSQGLVHSFCEGRLIDAPVSEGGCVIRCLEVMGDEVDKGLSGGPVMIKEKGRLYVVGVVSRRNSMNSEKFYAVPVTVIENLEARQWKE